MLRVVQQMYDVIKQLIGSYFIAHFKKKKNLIVEWKLPEIFWEKHQMAGFEAIQVMVTEVKLLKYCQRKPQVAGYASMTKVSVYKWWTDEFSGTCA